MTDQGRTEARTDGFRYVLLADQFEEQIRNGTFRAGEKLPSIRRLRSQTGLSISTISQAFLELEKRGVACPRRRSGYYVRPLLEHILPAPQPCRRSPEPLKVSVNDLAFTLCESMQDPDILQLGGALINEGLLPGKALADIFRRASRERMHAHLANYTHYQGYLELRRQIARHGEHLFDSTDPEKMVVTNGCMEAVTLCLQAVAGPGDTILVESPTFPWFLQVIEDFNMYALEIPAHPKEGIDPGVLSDTIRRHPVKACILIADFNNPQGYLISEERKKAIVEILADKEIPVIEDDIYGDLFFGPIRPKPLKSFDRKEMVLYCGSFSKTLSPGLRVGWTLPGRFIDKVKRLKLNQSMCGPALTQMAVADFMKSGGYERHLRKLRTALKNQVSNTALAVARHFPVSTKISAPRGGLTLWVQLPEQADSLEIFHRALKRRIAVLPGVICGSGGAYRNCIRVSCGHPWSARLDAGIETLGAIVRDLS